MTKWNELAHEKHGYIYPTALYWLGDYPYEFSRPEPIIKFFRKHGFQLVNLRDVGNNIGCNEYLFRPVD